MRRWCHRRGLAQQAEEWDRNNAGEVKVANSGAVLSRGSSRNLGSVALPDASGAAAAGAPARGGPMGKKPSALVGTRIVDGVEEVKVRWADQDESTWMGRDAFAAKFGKTTLTKLHAAFAKHDDAWKGSAISEAVADKRWPARARSSTGTKNWSQVEVNGTLIKLGDTVKVLVEQNYDNVEHEQDYENFGLAIVEELWDDLEEVEDNGEPRKKFGARWFHRARDTVLKTMATALSEDHIYAPDPRRVYLDKRPAGQEIYQAQDVSAILGRATCVCKNDVTAAALGTADFYYSLTYDPDQMVFQDIDESSPYPLVHPESDAPKRKAKPKKAKQPASRTISVCDVYAGTGGMGYMDTEMKRGGKDVTLETKWAVDFDESAVASWKRNRPEVHAYHMSVDDFLFLVKKWDDLSERFENWTPDSDDEDEDEEEEEKPEEEEEPAQEEAEEEEEEGGNSRRSRRAVKAVDRMEIDDDKSRYNKWLAGAKGRQAKEQQEKKQGAAAAKLKEALAQAEREPDAEETLALLRQAVKLGTGSQLGGAELKRAKELLEGRAAAESAETTTKQLLEASATAEAEVAAEADVIREEKKELAAAVAASVAEAEASSDTKVFIGAETFAGVKPGFAFRTGEQGPGYYRDKTQEDALAEKLSKVANGKKQEWAWSRDVPYRVDTAELPVYKGKPEAKGEPLMTLALGTEFTSKKGTFTVTGDSWIKVTKSSGIGLNVHAAWVPMKVQEKTLVEEVEEEIKEESDEEEYEIEKIVEMRVKQEGKVDVKNHPFRRGQAGKGDVGDIEFKIRWKGWDSSFDEWKTEEQISAPAVMSAWVKLVNREGRVPRPGQCDLVCGGPPCQGVSGFNRFRNDENPLGDPKNRQMLVFYELVNTLNPTWSLLENVADVFKFPRTWAGIYGRFAISRNIELGYQCRTGFMVAGMFGVAQYRLRCFIWGARSGEPLPNFPMPTHRVVKRATVMPKELNQLMVRAPSTRRLWREVRMGDILRDMPEIENEELRDERPYEGLNPRWTAELERDSKQSGTQYSNPERVLAYYRTGAGKELLNHVPLKMNADDKFRAEHTPFIKGANWEDMGELSKDKRSTLRHFKWYPDKDNNIHGEKLPPGDGRSHQKCIIPQYAVNSKIKTTGKKESLGRAWWDEIYSTCICRMQIHSHKNQVPHCVPSPPVLRLCSDTGVPAASTPARRALSRRASTRACKASPTLTSSAVRMARCFPHKRTRLLM